MHLPDCQNKIENIMCWQRRGAIGGLIIFWGECKFYTSEPTILLLSIHPREDVNTTTRRHAQNINGNATAIDPH